MTKKTTRRPAKITARRKTTLTEADRLRIIALLESQLRPATPRRTRKAA